MDNWRETYYTCIGNYNGIKSIRFFLRYCLACLLKEARERQYRIYVTDCLQALSGNAVSYRDLIAPEPEPIDVEANRSRILGKFDETEVSE